MMDSEMENAKLIIRGTQQRYAIFLRQQFSTVALHSPFRIFTIVLHSSFLTCSSPSLLSPTFFISVAAVFYRVLVFRRNLHVPIYWPHAERTQPSARFIRRTRAHASAIVRNFAREYEGAGGSRASFAADAFERIPRMTQYMFIRNYPESFPQAACVDCFARNHTRDVSTCSLKISSFR